MKISIRQKLFIFSFITVVVNGALSYTVYNSHRKHLESEQRVSHSQWVINQSHNVRSLGKQIQLDSKDFLITNNSSFLAHLDTINKAAFIYIHELRRLTADNPVQLRRTDSLELYMHQLVEFTQKKNELRRKLGLAAAISYADDKHPAEHIRRTIDSIQYGEASLLGQRVLTSDREEIIFSRFMIAVFVFMAGGIILLLIGAGKYLFQVKEKQKRADERQFDRENLDALINNTSDLMWSLDRDFRLITSNKPFDDILEMTSGKAVAKGDKILEATYSLEESNQYKILYDRAFAGESFTQIVYNSPPVHSWSEISYCPIRHEGKVMGTACHSRDITEKIKAEQQLREINKNLQKQSKELAISNADLEQFAYVASHDLQEPLRMVTSFMAQLEKKYGNVVEDKGRLYIHYALDGAKRMRQIILDLLDFSKVGHTEDDLEAVDINQLIREILGLHRRQIEESGAIIAFDGLPVLQTYKTPLRQIFQNLISNSLKYHKAGHAPIINISCTETSKQYRFTVEDNGIGIAPEYFEKIFTIFKRLHNKDEYSGTGMGLAISKKIAENLGGKIWVESKEGKGSTFYFTLLKTIRKPAPVNDPVTLEASGN